MGLVKVHRLQPKSMARSFLTMSLPTTQSLASGRCLSRQLSDSTILAKTWKTPKLRQHVNPLGLIFQKKIELEDNWVSAAYSNPHQGKFIVDIGCAKGSWSLEMCKQNPELNILGLEIRGPLVENSLVRKAKWNLTNVHYLSCNANVNILHILSSLQQQDIHVDTVALNFPDPQFKERHKKRRLVNARFVRDLGEGLKPESSENANVDNASAREGTKVFFQSDIFEVIVDMASHFSSSRYFSPALNYDMNDMENNKSPFPVHTEREISTLRHELPVYRMMFYRNSVEFDKRDYDEANEE